MVCLQTLLHCQDLFLKMPTAVGSLPFVSWSTCKRCVSRALPDPASQILGGRGGVGVSKTVYECPQLYPVDWLVPPNLKITRYTSALTRGTPSLCPQRLACCLTQYIVQKYQLIPVSGNPRSISYLGRFRAYIKQCRYRHFLTHL